MSSEKAWSTPGTLTSAHLFRSFCISVNVARHNAVMLYQKSSTLGNVACCHVVSELTTKSTCSECDIVFLEGICILQERCQVFLPGDLRRSYLDEEGHVMRRPSFLDTIAVGVASTGKVKGGGGGGESEEDSSSSTTLVPFLQQVVNTMGTGTSTAPLRRLAIRRMFELHSMEAAPGASLKKRRKEARNEMKKLTSFVFDCGGIDMGGMEEESTTHHVMNLVASNIQLLCKYASDEHLDAFLRWLIDFNCLEKEMKEERREEMTNGTGEGRQRVRMLLKTSFYELRPIRARMFDVLTSTLRNSLLHAFFNAKTSKGDLLYDNRKKTTTKMTKKTKKKRKRSRQDNEEEEGEEEASSSSSSSWLSTTLTSTTTHPTFAAFVEARGENDENTGLQKFLQLSVPDLKPMRHHLEQAQNVIQLVLGLPAGYLQDDINLESFVSLVLELDVLCSCSSDLNSVQSYLGTTRHALARLSSTHTTTVATLLSTTPLLLESLLLSATCCSSSFPWSKPTFSALASMARSSSRKGGGGGGEEEGGEDEKMVLQHSIASAKSLWMMLAAAGTTCCLSPSAVVNMTTRILEGVSIGKSSRSGSRSGSFSGNRSGLNVNNSAVELAWSADAVMTSEIATSVWWRTPEMVPGLLRLSQRVLITLGPKELQSNVATKMSSLLSSAMSCLFTTMKQEKEKEEEEEEEEDDDEEVEEEKKKKKKKEEEEEEEKEVRRRRQRRGIKTRRSMCTSILDFLSYFCTLEHEEVVMLKCLRLTLMLGTLPRTLFHENQDDHSTKLVATPGHVFVRFMNSSTTPNIIAKSMEILLDAMATTPPPMREKEDENDDVAMVSLQCLSAALTHVRRNDFWHIVSKLCPRVLNSIGSVNTKRHVMSLTSCTSSTTNTSTSTSTSTGNRLIDVRVLSLSVLLAMLRQHKTVTMGTREVAFCLQYLTFWSDATLTLEEDMPAAKRLSALTYDALTSILEYRPHALYSCASAYILVTRSMLRVAQRQVSMSTKTHLMRYMARIFEEMSKETHRNALRHYCLYLLHESITGLLQYGWPLKAREDFQHGLFCLLDVCTEYQSQMLFVGLNESGRSMLRKLRSQHQAQHMWNK